MKKNFYYLSLLLGLVFGMTMFTACGGGDDGDDPVPVPPTPQPESGEFQGPKRVFGDNLLSSFGWGSKYYEFTYDSNNLITKVKLVRPKVSDYEEGYTYEYEVTYSDKQITINRTRSGSASVRQYVITIGSNGFAESCTEGYLDKSERNVLKFEYDSEGHLTKAIEESDHTYGGTFTWQNGNIVAQNGIGDNDKRSCSYTYSDISNVAGLQIRATIGSLDDLYLPELYYMGLLGKGTAKLVKSYSYSDVYNETNTAENVWTLDDAGRPTKCVTTTIHSSWSTPNTSTYFWTYR